MINVIGLIFAFTCFSECYSFVSKCRNLLPGLESTPEEMLNSRSESRTSVESLNEESDEYLRRLELLQQRLNRGKYLFIFK